MPLRVEVDPALVRPADIPRLVGDPSRFAAATGWRPTRSIADTMGEMVAWWRAELGLRSLLEPGRRTRSGPPSVTDAQASPPRHGVRRRTVDNLHGGVAVSATAEPIARPDGASPTGLRGPVSAGIAERPPFGPMERLDHDRLRRRAAGVAASPRRRYSLSSKALFAAMDTFYGKPRTLSKFQVLELVARVPYQAWEHVAYVAVTHRAAEPGFARRVFDRVRTARSEQDNEQWHLLILEELLDAGDEPDSVRSAHRVDPAGRSRSSTTSCRGSSSSSGPAWSYRLNADFEDHAEHEYARSSRSTRSGRRRRTTESFADDFGHYDSLADLFRQIGYDERLHKLESEAAMAEPPLPLSSWCSLRFARGGSADPAFFPPPLMPGRGATIRSVTAEHRTLHRRAVERPSSSEDLHAAPLRGGRLRWAGGRVQVVGSRA